MHSYKGLNKSIEGKHTIGEAEAALGHYASNPKSGQQKQRSSDKTGKGSK